MTFVIANLHGELEKFRSLLELAHFSDKDTLYVLGDIVDYGRESIELVEDLSLRLNVYPIAGEHDYTAARMLAGYEKMTTKKVQPTPEFITGMTEWVKDGGGVTMERFRELDRDAKEGVLDYLCDLPLFEEFSVGGKDYLAVHAGISGYRAGTDPDDYEPADFFEEVPDPDYPLVEGKILLVGHEPTKSGKIERGNGTIYLDCGVRDGGKLALLCLDNGKEYYI